MNKAGLEKYVTDLREKFLQEKHAWRGEHIQTEGTFIKGMERALELLDEDVPTVTEYTIRGVNTGRIYMDFSSDTRKEVQQALNRERAPQDYEIVERQAGDWKVSPQPAVEITDLGNGTKKFAFADGLKLILQADVLKIIKES